MINASLRFIGRISLQFIQTIGRCCLMLWHTIWGKPHPKLFPLVIGQVFQLGILSLPIILTSALFIGMVLAFQGYNVLVGYSAEEAWAVWFLCRYYENWLLLLPHFFLPAERARH